MDSPTSWIVGLMRENYESVGFIPGPAVERQYAAHGRYILQKDERGRKVGYLLHGPLYPNHSVVISQHCIQYEQRLRGYGELAVAELIKRAIREGSTSIRLRVADDLPAVFFWKNQGFTIEKIVPGGMVRDRQIFIMSLPLVLPLFGEENRRIFY